MSTGKLGLVVVWLILMLATVQVVSADIAACDVNRVTKYTFSPGEDVYVKGYDLPDRSGTIYVTKNVDWTQVPTGTPYSQVAEIVIEINGVSDDELLASPPFKIGVVSNNDYPYINCIPYPGEYDVIWDNGNGKWDGEGTDPVDYVQCNGFETIPEFTTIAVPVAIALLAGLFFFRRQ